MTTIRTAILTLAVVVPVGVPPNAETYRQLQQRVDHLQGEIVRRDLVDNLAVSASLPPLMTPAERQEYTESVFALRDSLDKMQAKGR